MQFLIILVFVQQVNLIIKFSESNQWNRERFWINFLILHIFRGIEVILSLFFPKFNVSNYLWKLWKKRFIINANFKSEMIIFRSLLNSLQIYLFFMCKLLFLTRLETCYFFQDWILLLWKIHHKVASQEKF